MALWSIFTCKLLSLLQTAALLCTCIYWGLPILTLIFESKTGNGLEIPLLELRDKCVSFYMCLKILSLMWK